jgi:hypothetical protein
MQFAIYSAAVSELAIPKLGKFVKEHADTLTTLDGWSKMKAAEKREALLTALGAEAEARKAFVAFYFEETGSEQDWSEWETADLPEDAGLTTVADETDDTPELPLDGTDAGQSELELPAAPVAIIGGGTSHPQFVEGAFEQIVSDVAGLDAENSDKNLRELSERQAFDNLRMGVLLSHIQSSQHYITLGYDNMRTYLSDQFGDTLQYRKAMFLISNANAVKELGISAKELEGVSWSALRYIVPVMNSDNYGYWLDAARNLTHVALREQIQHHKAKEAGALPAPGADDADKPKPKSKLFNLFPDQKATVDAAIEKAKAEGNVESAGAALDLIAASFTGKAPSNTSVASVMPDTTVDGLTKVFSKMNADQGMDGLMAILSALEAVWPDVEMHVHLPEVEAAE